MKFDFNKAVFTYAISQEEIETFSQHLALGTQNLTINYTDATAVYHAISEECEIAIIGLCVDAYGMIDREDLASETIRSPEHTIEAVYEFSNRFGGKYVVIYSDSIGCYIFGDATCSIPINYSGSLLQGKIFISPFDRMTGEYFGYEPDPQLLKMRQSADPAQTMPGDLTPYRQVKALLPNQYLNLVTGEPIRREITVPELPFDETINRSISISKNLAKEFSKHYKIICPLTSGYDSRVVLSILREISSDPECFTTRFSTEETEDDDIRIASSLCQKEGISHRIFGIYDLPADYLASVNDAAGLINSTQTIQEAYSYLIEAGEKARINGNIIGQIGKSSVTNTVPDSLATASFLTCKIHNRDRQCRTEMEEYIGELKKSSDRICDLFAYENRCGRWGGQEEALYSICGMNSLNIFNCRELILYWISIPRKQRVKNAIHLTMIQRTNPEMMNEPFNPGDRFSFLKNNWMFYYIATYAKQMLVRHNIHCD